MKNRKIFIALNNFEIPNPLADYGTFLAKDLEKKAYLFGLAKVPVYTPPVSITGSGIQNPVATEITTIQEKADTKLEILCSNLKKIYPNIEYNIDIGFPEPSIVNHTEENIPYCVVLERTSELSTLHEWFGTYATRLAENIEVPVLVLPQNFTWSPINKILYVMDLQDHKVENMRFLSSITKALKAKLTVVVVNNGQTKKQIERYNLVVNTMKHLLAYNNITFHQIFGEESSEIVNALMIEEKADWLAFEHKSQSLLQRVFKDYNTKRLILQSDRPVLVF